jgi:hypothetical protein
VPRVRPDGMLEHAHVVIRPPPAGPLVHAASTVTRSARQAAFAHTHLIVERSAITYDRLNLQCSWAQKYINLADGGAARTHSEYLPENYYR